jgi:hypothetical protein
MRLRSGVALGLIGWLAVWGRADGAERDLYSGLAYLRAGAQQRAEESLIRYRDAQRDPGIRRSIDQVLPLLRRPLSDEVREYIAASLEERVQAGPGGKPSHWSRMFPVFP